MHDHNGIAFILHVGQFLLKFFTMTHPPANLVWDTVYNFHKYVATTYNVMKIKDQSLALYFVNSSRYLKTCFGNFV